MAFYKVKYFIIKQIYKYMCTHRERNMNSLVFPGKYWNSGIHCPTRKD